MMPGKKKQITVDIKPDGTVTADVAGVEGPVCSTELDKLLKGLGTQTAETKKVEFATPNKPVRLTAAG